MHKFNAWARGIAWELTFEEWWEIWAESGKWEQRGKGRHRYQMCRTGDTGPYSKDNVRIDTQLENMREMMARRKDMVDLTL